MSAMHRRTARPYGIARRIREAAIFSLVIIACYDAYHREYNYWRLREGVS